MLHTFDVTFRHDSEERVNPYWANLTHGLLMEAIPEEQAELLHSSALRPYSQSVAPSGDGKLLWKIRTWDDDLAQAIEAGFAEGEQYALKQKQANLICEEIKTTSMTEAEWALPFYSSERAERSWDLRVKTTASHKSGGAYLNFPSADLIMRGLFKKLATFSGAIGSEDEAAMESVARSAIISNYALRSSSFSLEGTRINGYRGLVTVYFRGNENLVRLSSMVLNFAEYAGVGIKTALGMGSCEVCAARERINASKGPAAKTKKQSEDEIDE